jgi:hypothetical protein
VSPHVQNWLMSSPAVNITPSSGGLPGAGELEALAGGIGFWALIACVVGLVIGAGAWALGSHTNNYQASSSGRRAVIVSAMAAVVVGAAPIVVNFLFSAGTKF